MISQVGHSLITERLRFLLCYYDQVIDKERVPSGGVNMMEVLSLSLSPTPTFSPYYISMSSTDLSVQSSNKALCGLNLLLFFFHGQQ